MFDPTLARMVAETRTQREAIFRSFEEVLISDNTTTCRKRCTHCCFWPFVVSVLEGAAIFEWLHKHHKWVPSLRDHVKSVADKVTGLACQTWTCSNIPCPFLDRSGMCSIYPVRPLSCHLSVSFGDPESCQYLKSSESIGRKAPILLAYHMQEERMLKHVGIKMYTMPLATAVLIAADLYEQSVDMDRITTAIFLEHLGRL